MTYLSVDEQDAAIRRLFPDFRLTANADWIGVWEGPVRPASKTYRIRIVYFRRTIFDGWTLANRLRDCPRRRSARRRGGAGEREATAAHLLERPQPGLAGAVPLGSERDVLDARRCRSRRRSFRGRRNGCCSSNTGRYPANSSGRAGTREGGATHVRTRPRLQTRRSALERSDSATTNSTGLAERPAFSDPIYGWRRH